MSTKIESGTKVHAKVSIKEVKSLPMKEGFVVLTESTEYNPSGVWQFENGKAAQATMALVGLNIYGAKTNLETAILELAAITMVATSMRQPVVLEFDAIFGNQGESRTNEKTGEVSTYRKTGWNNINTTFTLSAVAKEELIASNRERGSAVDIAIAVAQSTGGKRRVSIGSGNTPQATQEVANDLPFNEASTEQIDTKAEVAAEV